MLIAKALYDNEAETGDELSFDREDILAVLEQEVNGMEGWWLCSLRGKTGIVPANRLQVIHKIDVRPSSAAVKGPRFPSEEVRSMDYDFPKPVIPRKLGGSFDNLLTVTEDEGYRSGVAVSQLSQSCRSTSGKLEVQASLGKKRGASIDNMFNCSHFTEYAVPVSLSPDDDNDNDEVPGKNSGIIGSNNLAKSRREKGMNTSGLSAKNSQPPKTSTSSYRLYDAPKGHQYDAPKGHQYDAPKGHPDCHPKNLTVSKLKIQNRDSGLADYDFPKQAATAPAPFESAGAKYPFGKSQTAQQPLELTAKSPARQATVATRDPQSNASLSNVPKCDTIDPAFLASISGVQNAVVQITSYADKWRSCSNPVTKQSIVKQVCIAAWKKLQALIVEFSKCLARCKGRASEPLADRLGAIKVATAELERILNYISSCQPNDIHKGSIDYVAELVIIAKDIASHLDYCNSILNGDLRDLLDCPNKTSKQVRFSRPSDSEHPTSPETDTRQMLQRRAPPLPPPRATPKILVNSDDDFPVSATWFNTKTPTYGRSFSYDHLSSDYDTPKNSSSETGSNHDRASDKMATPLRLSGVRSSDVVRAKRDAVVIEKSQETFDILERRSPQRRIVPSKLIAGRLNSGLTDKADSLDNLNAVDYDYPRSPITDRTEISARNQNVRVLSRDLDAPITIDDKKMLVFYGERLNTEVNQLKDIYHSVCHRSAEASDGQGALSAQIHALIICTHRLVFIGDTFVKKLSGVGLKKQLQRLTQEIVDKTKSVALVATSTHVSRKNVNRQQLLDGTRGLLTAALTFQDIVIRCSEPH